MILSDEKKVICVVQLNQTDKDSETGKAIDHLKAGCSVIVNFSDVESSSAFTILYNLLGATYALNGNYHKVGDEVYLFSTTDIKLL